MFAPVQIIEARVFSRLPESFRRRDISPERRLSGRSMPVNGCFLEGPSFDREGGLYVTDIPHGRIFRVSPAGDWELALEYDGQPNGLKIHRDGRLFIADYQNGLMTFDPASGKLAQLLTGYKGERFKGLNDLVFSDEGDLFFTDQGQTALNDPTGRVYRLRAGGQLDLLADYVPSPNGLVLSAKGDALYVAVTRANAIWRLPLAADGTVVRAGHFIQLSGGRGPDGMALDEAGGLAVVHPDMGAAWIFNHRGEPCWRVQSPCSDLVTNCAYGGPDRRTLYITDSLEGCILAAEVPVAGRPMYSHAAP